MATGDGTSATLTTGGESRTGDEATMTTEEGATTGIVTTGGEMSERNGRTGEVEEGRRLAEMLSQIWRSGCAVETAAQCMPARSQHVIAVRRVACLSPFPGPESSRLHERDTKRCLASATEGGVPERIDTCGCVYACMREWGKNEEHRKEC